VLWCYHSGIEGDPFIVVRCHSCTSRLASGETFVNTPSSSHVLSAHVCMYSHLICHYVHSTMSCFLWSTSMANECHLVFSGFRHELPENCALRGCYDYHHSYSSLHILCFGGKQAFFGILEPWGWDRYVFPKRLEGIATTRRSSVPQCNLCLTVQPSCTCCASSSSSSCSSTVLLVWPWLPL
jgi:hypothetical protein